MGYVFAAIVEQEDVDETWVPRVTDKDGRVAWHQEDGKVTSFVATGMTVYRGKIDDKHRVLGVDGVDIAVYVSRARIVAVCRKYDKGGGWIGTPGAMILANAVSKARAKIRSHGKFLVGQMRWPWLTDVGYTEKTSWTTSNRVRLVAQDGEDGSWIYVDLELPKRASARSVAHDILTAAVASRRASASVAEEHRATLDAARLPKYDASSKRFAMAAIPGGKRALASTARPEAVAAPAPSPALEQLSQAVAAAAREDEPVPIPIPVAAEAEVERVCSACDRPAAEGARFCRACGSPVVGRAIEPEPEPEPVAAPEPACARCDAPLKADAKFCRSCGHPVAESEARTAVQHRPPAVAPLREPAPASPPPAPPAPTRGRRAPAMLAAIVVLLAAGGGAAYLVLDRSDTPTATAATRTTAATGEDAALPAVDEAAPEPTPVDTETPEPLAVGSLVAGRYARLGTFRTQERAQDLVDEVQAAGVDAQAMSSNDGATMMPAFWVVVAGPLDTSTDERRVLRNARRAGIRDGFVDQLEPTAGQLDPVELAGDFHGDAKQVNASVKRLNRTIPTTFSFGDDGQSGEVTYDKPSCTGTLSLVSTEDAVATYDESITDGKCIDGGQWYVRLDGGDLLATWWRENELTFVTGRLSR